MSLEQVLADLREDATILDRNGHKREAEYRKQLAERIEQSCPEYLGCLDEAAAAGYRGCSVHWLRARFEGWQQRGLARQVGPRRYYRLCVLEHKGSPSIAREAGRQAYKGAA